MNGMVNELCYNGIYIGIWRGWSNGLMEINKWEVSKMIWIMDREEKVEKVRF